MYCPEKQQKAWCAGTQLRALMDGLAQLEADFALLESWEDRYRTLIHMGNQLESLTAGEKIRGNKVSGCVSQVWLVAQTNEQGKLNFRGTSDALIVRGLIALLLLLYDNKTPREILSIDAAAAFERLGLAAHITPQRSDGFSAMVQRIQKFATLAV